MYVARWHKAGGIGCPSYLTQLSSHQEKAMLDTPIPTPPGFAELSKAEQLRYLQALWDQISEHPPRDSGA
jgi:hypothetical protein